MANANYPCRPVAVSHDVATTTTADLVSTADKEPLPPSTSVPAEGHPALGGHVYVAGHLGAEVAAL